MQVCASYQAHSAASSKLETLEEELQTVKSQLLCKEGVSQYYMLDNHSPLLVKSIHLLMHINFTNFINVHVCSTEKACN